MKGVKVLGVRVSTASIEVRPTEGRDRVMEEAVSCQQLMVTSSIIRFRSRSEVTKSRVEEYLRCATRASSQSQDMSVNGS